MTLRETLLYQRFSPGSLLFSDGEVEHDADAARVTHRRSEAAEAALAEMRADVARIRAGELDPFVPPS